MTVTATQLLDLLAARHAKDVFVPECKTGPTWYGAPIRLDAWAMRKSWAHADTYGYEIKVSRSDFLRDDKWTAYLDYCSHFSFVCPPGTIEPSEVPQDVGLIVSSKNGKRLYTKRKASPRDVEIPESLWRYLLMWRCRIVDFYEKPDNAAFWRAWLQGKREKHDLGFAVSRSLARRFKDKCGQVVGENARLQRQNETLGRLKEQLRAIGVDPDRDWINADDVERRVSAAQSGLNPLILREARSLHKALSALLDMDRRLKGD